MPRRGNNEGSIVKRADGRWMAQVSMPDGTRKTAYAHTRADAQARLKDLHAEVERAGRLMPGVAYRTMGDFFAAWLAMIEQSVKPATVRHYRYMIRLAHELETVPPAKLTPQHLQKLLARRLADGLSPTTVHHLYGVLHHVCATGVRQGVFDRNLMEMVDAPRVRRHEMATLSLDAVQALLSQLRENRYYALFVLAIATGMRQGEILGLRWPDVDCEHGTIAITRALQRVKGEPLLMEPKSASSRRLIAVGAATAHALEAHRERQVREREILADQWIPGWNLVFCTQKGLPLHPGYLVHRVFEPALARAGLPHMRFHDLRHTAATLMLKAGVHPKVVSEMLGHSSIGLTLDTYSHTTHGMHSQAAETMDRLILHEEAGDEATPLLALPPGGDDGEEEGEE